MWLACWHNRLGDSDRMLAELGSTLAGAKCRKTGWSPRNGWIFRVLCEMLARCKSTHWYDCSNNCCCCCCCRGKFRTHPAPLSGQMRRTGNEMSNIRQTKPCRRYKNVKFIFTISVENVARFQQLFQFCKMRHQKSHAVRRKPRDAAASLCYRLIMRKSILGLHSCCWQWGSALILIFRLFCLLVTNFPTNFLS